MKSNQERSNECLPPKKREIPASTLASEERSAAPGPATDSQRTENLAWLASVASGHRNASDVDGPQYKPSATEPAPPPSCTSSSSSSASSDLRLVSSLPTVYTSPLSQPTVGGAIHYTQLPPSLQFIASPYPSSYTGYISSQLLPPPPPPPPLSSSSSHSSPSSASLAPHRPSHAETAFTSPSTCSSSSSALCPPSSHSQASKYDQQRMSAARASMPPPSTDATPHYVHLSAAPRTAASAHHHHHHHHHQGGAHLPTLPLHPHHSMAHGTSQVLVQYADGPNRKEEGGTRPREPHNGELERGRRYGVSPDSGFSKPGSKLRDVPPPPPPPSTYEGRQLVLPADYASHDPSGLRASLMLMPNSHRDHQQLQPQASPDKRPGSAPGHPDKGGMALGKPVNRTASSSSPTFAFPSPLSVDSLKASASGSSSPHTVIQTTQNATEPMSLGLSSTSIFPQPPIIGYIAGSGSQQQPISYHAGLSQHLLIPGTQPVIIPVSSGGAGVTPTDATTPHLVSSTQAPPFPGPLPHTYIVAAATTKGEVLDTPCATYHQVASGTAVQAQLHLPVVAPPPSSTSLPPSLPPYFIKGSIIQLADGELKRVEDLKTEDFIQSAEISSELKIDSSTVERIDGSHASPNIAVVQFSVGEHRSQVSVEVLVEYPFFVFGQGWSSCCPDRTTQLLELPCSKLSVGDVCISLTLKNLRNGALKKAQSLEFAIPSSNASHGHPTPLRGPAAEAPRCSGPSSRHGERENGVNSRGAGGTENGDLRFVERGSVSKDQAAAGADATPGKTSTSRKRRWSAPEGRKVERTEEEPPMALPKPSFIPHEVKVSIEGRSNVGK